MIAYGLVLQCDRCSYERIRVVQAGARMPEGEMAAHATGWSTITMSGTPDRRLAEPRAVAPKLLCRACASRVLTWMGGEHEEAQLDGAPVEERAP